jgi:hypothetical protein
VAYCSECGGLNAEALRFCIHCGKEITAQKKSAVVAQSQTVPAAPTSVTSNSSKASQGQNKSTPLIVALCLLVLILAGVVYLMSQSESTEISESATALEEVTMSSTSEEVDQLSVLIPSDAEPIEIISWNSIDTSPQYPMTEFKCVVLAISYEFDECMSSTTLRGSFAVTVQKRPSQLDNFDYFYFEVIKYVENGGSSFASAVFSTSLRNENLENGLDLGVALQKLKVTNGEAVIVQSRIYGGSRTYSGYYLWGLDGNGLPRLFANFGGEGMRPLAAGDFLVLTEYAYREGEPMCCGTLTNHYRVYFQSDRWYVQRTVLDKSEADLLEAGYLVPVESSELLIEGEMPVFADAAPEEYWIDGYEMAQPACDGSFITIVMGAGAGGIISGVTANPEASYLRTDITCASLNPTFNSGSLKGQPIYILFYGPYQDRFEAQNKCLDLGITKKANCYVAPLTNQESDRQVRYGPNDD